MNLEKLKVFQTVVQLGSFTGAAEKLYLTQSAISKQIKALEEYYNTPLFDRIGNKTLLTPAGETLLSYVNEILNLAGEARGALRELQDLHRGTLHISTSMTVGVHLLPRVLNSFRESFPNIDVTVDITNSVHAVESVLSGTAEIGLVGAIIDRHNLNYLPFYTEHLKLIVGYNHPWAKKLPETPDELANQHFLLREKGSGMRKMLEDRLLEYGVKLKSKMELGSTEVIIRFVETGIGVSIVSEHAVSREVELGLIKALNLPFLDLKRYFYMVYNKEKSPTAAFKAFVHHMENGFEHMEAT